MPLAVILMVTLIGYIIVVENHNRVLNIALSDKILDTKLINKYNN